MIKKLAGVVIGGWLVFGVIDNKPQYFARHVSQTVAFNQITMYHTANPQNAWWACAEDYSECDYFLVNSAQRQSVRN